MIYNRLIAELRLECMFLDFITETVFISAQEPLARLNFNMCLFVLGFPSYINNIPFP